MQLLALGSEALAGRRNGSLSTSDRELPSRCCCSLYMGGKTLCFTPPARLPRPGLYNMDAVASNLQSACQPAVKAVKAVKACHLQVSCCGIHVRQEALLCYYMDVTHNIHMVIIAGIMS